MLKYPVAWTLALAVFGATAAPARAHEMSFVTHIDNAKRLLTADEVHMEFSRDGHENGEIVTVRRDQTVAPHVSASTPLRVTASANGGVRVQPSSDGSCSAVLCMAAGATSHAASERILAQLSVVNEAGELTVHGPDDGDWAAYIILSVPPDVALDVTAKNGELNIRDVGGRFTLHAQNGPIAIADVTGQVDGETTNGPIHFRGHSGDIHLRAQNGPVGVDLSDPVWSGKGLDASTVNGPVQLIAPAGLRTGVRVVGSQNSPFNVHTTAQAMDDLPGGVRSVQLGAGPVLVRLSTLNGPVEIKRPKASKAPTRTSRRVTS